MATIGKEGADDNCKKIVMVAVDESPQAEYALKFYASTVHSPRHQLYVVYVAEAPPLPTRIGDKYMYNGTELWEDLVQEEKRKSRDVEAKFHQKLKEHQLEGEVQTIFHSKAGVAIVEKAQELGAELVVMGTRGMGKIRRTIFGSVSDYVLHHVACPVLITRM